MVLDDLVDRSQGRTDGLEPCFIPWFFEADHPGSYCLHHLRCFGAGPFIPERLDSGECGGESVAPYGDQGIVVGVADFVV